MDWTEDAIERYSRQVVMKDISLEGQEKLCQAYFALPNEKPWSDMADLLVRSGMRWDKEEGHWLRSGDEYWFLMARPTETSLCFLMSPLPLHCTEDIATSHPLFGHPALSACLATWWAGFALGLKGQGEELVFTETSVTVLG